MSSIPLVDISPFISNDHSAEARKKSADQFATAIRIHGCAAITGHGLPEEDLKDVFSMMRKLFDLPISEKMKAPHPDALFPHRGYLAKAVEKSGKLGAAHSKSEVEKAFLADALDWKESYDIGHEDNDTQKNIWLPDDVLIGFRPYMVNMFDRLATISKAILEALMLGMGLSPEDCEAMRRVHTPIEHQMRLAHYLPMSPDNQKDPNIIRLAPHKDFSSYTLLFQETKSGLEFQNRETEEYMSAVPKEGVMYLNIGDLLERYSNGFYPSAMHRVTIPLTKNEDGTIPGRYSLPYFMNIGFEELIYPMPSRVKVDGKANYEDITYQALAAKLVEPVMDGKKE